MITPLLKKIINNSNKKEIEYFLILALIFGSVLPALATFERTKWLVNIYGKMQVTMFGGFIGYYVLGYYIKKFDIKKSCRKLIYCLAGLSILGTLFITYRHTALLEPTKRFENAYSYTWPNIAIMATAMVIYFKYNVSKIKFNKIGKKVITALSRNSLNIYLAQDIFIIILAKKGIMPNNINSIVGILGLSFIVFISSYILSEIINLTKEFFLKNVFEKNPTNSKKETKMKKSIQNVKKYIEKYVQDKNLLIIALLVIAFFGMLIHVEYATDTYCVFSVGGREIVQTFINSGRVITAGFFAVCKVLKFSNNMIYRLSFLIALASMTISIYVLNNSIKTMLKNKLKEKPTLIISIITILNIFAFELFLYVEKGIMVSSVLFAVIAFDIIVKFFEEKKFDYKKLILSLIMMILATFSYQGTAALFIALATVYIATNTKSVKDFFYKNIVVALLYGIPGILNFIIVKVFGITNRITGNIVLKDSLIKIYESTRQILEKTFEMMPQYLFISVCGVIIAYTITKIIKEKNTIKTKLLKILGIVYILAGTIVSAVFPQIMQNTASIWLVPRSVYPMAALIGLLLMYEILNTETTKNEKIGIYVLVILMLFMQFVPFQRIYKDRYTSNYLDKVEGEKIKEVITQYEEQTNIEVTKVAFYNDKETKYVYDNIKAVGDVNVRGFAVDWSAIAALEILSNKELKKVEPVEEIKQEFITQDWKEFNEQQIKIVDDTLHICLY